MKMLVLGAGLQGSACAFDLLETTDPVVRLADCRFDNVPAFLTTQKGKRLECWRIDVRDEHAILRAMDEHDAVLSALPYYFNYPMPRLAVQAGVRFTDLGGNTEIVRQQETLHDQALANILATPYGPYVEALRLRGVDVIEEREAS